VTRSPSKPYDCVMEVLKKPRHLGALGEALRSVHEHMLGLGLGALTHANWHANYFSPDNDYWSELSVLQAAHAAEILIKARIAKEHPLLIFDHLPKSQNTRRSRLELDHLFEEGRTFQYADLPDRLWATTGITLPNVDVYRSFGRLRNAIQHFTHPTRDVSEDAIGFIYDVIDPFINECWGLFAVDFNEDYEPHKYLVEGLVRREVLFLISPAVIDEIDGGNIDLEWPKNKAAYKNEMETRITKARRKKSKKRS
jgi:hypothetical protein